MKVHNIDDLIPYYTSYETLKTFMNNITFKDGTKFSEDSWQISKGRMAHFRLSKKKKYDLLSLPKYEPLKFFWKFLTYLYLNRLTHIQPKRQGRRHSHRSLNKLIFFLAKKKIFYKTKDGYTNDTANINVNFFDNYIKFINKYTFEKGQKGQKEVKKLKNSSKRSYLHPVVHWHSIGEDLPLFMKLSFDPLQGKKVDDHYPQFGDNEPWKPIEEKTAFHILKESMSYINKYGDFITNLFYYKVLAERHDFTKEKLTVNNQSFSTKNSFFKYKVADLMNSSKILFDKDCPLSITQAHIKDWQKNKISASEFISKFHLQDIDTAIRLLIASCIILILFTTGMRRSEFYRLEKGCLKSNNSNNSFLLEVTVEKTEFDEDGKKRDIPIPDFLEKVIEILEEIGNISMQKNKSLFFNYFGDIVAGASLEEYSDQLIYLYLKKHSKNLGLKKAPTPHEYRKTIAWFIMTKSSKAAILLKELFNHKSLKMTLEYMHTQPLLQRELDEIANEYNSEIANDIASYAVQGKLAGPKGERILNALKSSRFKGLTGREIQQNTKQFLLHQINGKHNFLFVTKLSYCVRSSSSIDTAPCMLTQDGSDPLVGMIPRPSNCNPIGCKDSLYTPDNINNIEEEKIIYERVIEVSKKLDSEDKNKIFVLTANKKIRRLDEILLKLED